MSTIIVERESTIGEGNPLLGILVRDFGTGTLTDAYAIEFEIYDYTQEDPLLIVPRTAPFHVSTGLYIPVWGVPSTEALGTHVVRWYYKLVAASTEQTKDQQFVVALSATPPANATASARGGDPTERRYAEVTAVGELAPLANLVVSGRDPTV